MERLRVCYNLLYDRRNIVKLPLVIKVKIFSIVLQLECSAALLLYIISFGATARSHRRTTKLLQRRVKGNWSRV